MMTVGDKAPDFDVLADDGRQLRLSDLKGKTTVLYFYPKDDTPGCTKESCDFRDSSADFGKANAVIYGISLDNLKSHQAFRAKFKLPFPLLADESAQMSKAYGVYKKKSMFGRTYWGLERTTFVIGPDLKIKAIFPRVKVPGHIPEVLAAVRGA
jgi:peroxiredoxin Q/BCP